MVLVRHPEHAIFYWAILHTGRRPSTPRTALRDNGELFWLLLARGGNAFGARLVLQFLGHKSRGARRFALICHFLANSQDPLIRKARANVQLVVVLPGRCMDQLVVNVRRNVKELENMTALELQFERSMYFGFFMIANFGNALGRNVGSMHFPRVSFQQVSRRDVSNQSNRGNRFTASKIPSKWVRSPLPLAKPLGRTS